jgi:hypothetical protein
VKVTGHLLNIAAPSDLLHNQAFSVGLIAAAIHMRKLSQPTPASLLTQAAFCVAAGGGAVDLIAASVNDTHGAAEPLLRPDPGLRQQYGEIAAAHEMPAPLLLEYLAGIGRALDEASRLMAGCDTDTTEIGE